jgi:hypothetical protein
MSEPAPLTPREQGMADFKAGKHFGECPNQGFREADIDWRWHWQKGWLRAELEQRDSVRPPNYKI